MRNKTISAFVLVTLLSFAVICITAASTIIGDSSNNAIEYVEHENSVYNELEDSSLLLADLCIDYNDKKISVLFFTDKIYTFKFNNSLFKPPVFS